MNMGTKWIVGSSGALHPASEDLSCVQQIVVSPGTDRRKFQFVQTRQLYPSFTVNFSSSCFILKPCQRRMPMCTCKPEGKVNACPETKEAWEARAEAKRAGCHYEEVYHCLSDKDDNKWEKCLQKTLILQGNCPIITSDGYLDWRACDSSDSSCPNHSYVSDEVYKFSLCFGHNFHANQTLGSIRDSAVEDSSPGVIIGVVFTNLLIIGAAILAFLIIRRRLRKKRRLLQPNRDADKNRSS
uniref:Uncharacterized protein LOC111134132 isoform X4 n=1 Tax=Crassostrea virginica TaxID=6565 RepID=A0A8B8EGB0_CRAVI|nr:uncharacterized protein LOC111134132 isoform X4 [Crassostrea virginica]